MCWEIRKLIIFAKRTLQPQQKLTEYSRLDLFEIPKVNRI
jgi:hypothetical protein